MTEEEETLELIMARAIHVAVKAYNEYMASLEYDIALEYDFRLTSHDVEGLVMTTVRMDNMERKRKHEKI